MARKAIKLQLWRRGRVKKRCLDRVGGVAPSTKRCSTRFSQSRAAWQYQPFHQPVNARPCLLPNTHCQSERAQRRGAPGKVSMRILQKDVPTEAD